MRRLFVLLPILGTLIAAGCAQVGSLTADQIADKILAAQQSDRAVHSTTVMTMTISAAMFGDLSMGPVTTHTEQWSRGPELMRAEMTTDMSGVGLGATGTPAAASITLVRNGDKVWMFMPDMNAYEEMNASAMDALSPQQAATLTRQMIEDLVSKLDIALAGREEVAGVDTYHLQAAPKPDASSTSFMGIPGVKPGPADLWIDPDTWTPLKIHVSVTEDLSAMAAQMGIEEGDPSQLGTMEVTMDMVVTDIAYDVDIPDETFTFEPPVGAQKMQPESFGVPGGPGGASGAEATVPASGAP